MAELEEDLEFSQGTDFTYRWPVNDGSGVAIPDYPAGWSAIGQVRSLDGKLLLDLMVENGILELDGPDHMYLTISRELSRSWDLQGPDWRHSHYEIKLRNPADKVAKIVFGKFGVKLEWQRPEVRDLSGTGSSAGSGSGSIET
jgi:hypothetical protein